MKAPLPVVAVLGLLFSLSAQWVGAGSATPAEASQFINGNFDSGPGIGWTDFSKRGFDVVVAEFGTGVSAASSPFAGWLGGSDFEQAYVQQCVGVTQATPVLRYLEWLDSDEVNCTFDLARVYASGMQVASSGLCKSNNTNGWQERKVDLSAFAGNVCVRLQVDTDESFVSSQYVDDVRLEASPLGAITVSTAKNGALVRLTWQHNSPYTGYEVWRSLTPFFVMGANGSEKRADVPPPAVGTTTIYDDAGAIGNLAANYFYLIRGTGAGTTRSSNRNGEFDFQLNAGT